VFTNSPGCDQGDNIPIRDNHAGTGHDFLYNDADRLIEVKRNSLTEATYVYNALGERVIKDDALAS